ncbi:hypothetical protein BX661DRAFT_176919 [Kickxella alabastrina]|uniref:uncharacterized protein n=1 Tax=Kickxella alabastrina TaxID=61397 RepID=UPI00221E7BDB|nr:uncharacterized protein BX661DRAFT_176919 [Kickxella alabastrina]KAI7834285.1 hypothetical protein BX661DRAFT_176919 [Kickxella alabastrina]
MEQLIACVGVLSFCFLSAKEKDYHQYFRYRSIFTSHNPGSMIAKLCWQKRAEARVDHIIWQSSMRTRAISDTASALSGGLYLPGLWPQGEPAYTVFRHRAVLLCDHSFGAQNYVIRL